MQIADGQTSNYFLTTFGRSPRTTVCAGEATTEPTLSQALHMINGDTLTRKIGESKRLQAQLDAGQKPAQVVESIYIACLSRKPSPEEMTKARGPLGRRAQCPHRRRRHLVGGAELARIPVQSLMRSLTMNPRIDIPLLVGRLMLLLILAVTPRLALAEDAKPAEGKPAAQGHLRRACAADFSRALLQLPQSGHEEKRSVAGQLRGH